MVWAALVLLSLSRGETVTATQSAAKNQLFGQFQTHRCLDHEAIPTPINHAQPRGPKWTLIRCGVIHDTR
eukprot:6162322-Amphidinium_carterae.1